MESVSGAPILITSEGSEPLREGTTLPPAGRLSLGEESRVTLSEGSRTLELFRRGLYEIGELFTFRPLGRIDFEGVFEARIKRLNLESKDSGTDTLIATRSPNGSGGDGLSGLGEGARELARGNYAAAREELVAFIREEGGNAEKSTLHVAQILTAQAAYFQEDNGVAYQTLSEIEPSRDHSHFPLYELLKAQLLVESHAFGDALEVLAEFLRQPRGSDADLQTARLLTGVAYEGLGNFPVARTYYRRATSPDPTTPAAKAARRLLE